MRFLVVVAPDHDYRAAAGKDRLRGVLEASVARQIAHLAVHAAGDPRVELGGCAGRGCAGRGGAGCCRGDAEEPEPLRGEDRRELIVGLREVGFPGNHEPSSICTFTLVSSGDTAYSYASRLFSNG